MGCNRPSLGRGLQGPAEGDLTLVCSAPHLQWNKVAAWAEVGKVSTPFILCGFQTSPAKRTPSAPPHPDRKQAPTWALIPTPARHPLRSPQDLWPQGRQGDPPEEDTRGPAASRSN